MKNSRVYALFLLLFFCISCKGQNRTEIPKDHTITEINDPISAHGPKGIVRNIIQDKKGNIWMASWAGIFRYDGRSFTNMTVKISSARFFSLLENREGNFWFGSVGSGVYNYDGKSFQNYTTRQGLAGNAVACIYEDKTGAIWFGTDGGVSRYDGKIFKNFTIRDGLPRDDMNSIIQDKTGKFWFGAGGKAFVYDGKKFVFLTHNGKPFINVRSIIEDEKGNIWLGGADGLWRYDGKTFTNLTKNFVGSIMEDRKGSIWTGSKKDNSQTWPNPRFDGKSPYNPAWVLSRYDGKTLSNKKPSVTEVTSIEEMICGILEAKDGSIWFGTGTGVYRYDRPYIPH